MRPLVLLSSLQTGGAERVTVTFLERLAERGMAVDLCTVASKRDGPLAAEVGAAGIRRHDLGASRLVDLFALRRYVALLRRERYDLVHAHGQDAVFMARLGRRFTGIPYVVTRHVVHESGEWPYTPWLRLQYVLAAMRAADARVHVSPAVDFGKIGDARVIPNGIDVERFADSSLRARRDAIRASLGLEPADAVVAIVAVLRGGKGHEDLFRAWPLVARRVPRARLLVVGDGDQAKHLRALAGPLGDSVRFLGMRTDVPQILAATDVVALPSCQEALPTALIEAAAAGLPVVASSEAGGKTGVVVEGETGLVLQTWIENGDFVIRAEPLADALVPLLLDDALARRMGAAARERARRLYTVDAQIDATLALWEELLARRKRAK